MGAFTDLLNKTKTSYTKINIPQYAKPNLNTDLKIGKPKGTELTQQQYDAIPKLSAPTGQELQADIFGNPIKPNKDPMPIALSKDIGGGFKDAGGAFLKFVSQPFFSTAKSLAQELPTGDEEFMPKTAFEKLLYGEETITPLSKKISGNLQGEELFKGSNSILVAGTVGGAFLDLTLFGGSRKALSEQIVKEVTENGMRNLLRKAGVSDDLIEVFTPQATKIDNLADAEKLIANIEKIQATSKNLPDTKILQKIDENLKNYQTHGGYSGVGKPVEDPMLRDLAKISETLEAKTKTKTSLNKAIQAGLVKPNPDGTITAYRVGEVSPLNELASVTYDKSFAQSFDRTGNAKIQEIKIKPEDVKYFIGSVEKELLVNKNLLEVTKKPTGVDLPNIKPKLIRDEAKISELTAQKQNLQLKKETSNFFTQQEESNYQQFKRSVSKFKDIPEDAPQYKKITGRGVETDNLLYSQDLNEDEMYRKFLDRYDGDKKIAKDLANLQAEMRAVKGKAIKDYTSEQLARINAIAQDVSSVAKRETPLIAKSAGEARSAIAQADQALSKVPEIVRRKVSSLPKIISDSPYISNTQKVDVIDYLRTPDRVLNKIGLFNESRMLQQGYNAYVKELPKNIEKITQWSKQVPKESSKTIFQYLDGKKVTLNEAELKVAGEIKTWLKEWAERLKLPEDKTITNYITHIFDKELIAKEFDEDLAKIITDKIPGSVYDPFLLERLGAKGYKQNVWQALDAYVKRGTRKANMDDALKAIQDKVGSSLETSKVDVSAWKYVQKYIAGVNMRPTELDNLIDNSIKNLVGYKFGQRPVTYLTKLLRQMTYRGMLGLNASSALRNISQGINTYAVLGEKYTAIGYTKLFSKGAMQELAEEGVLLPGFIQDRVLSSTKKNIERMDKVLFAFFEGAEKINRGAAYFGAKSKALAQGKTVEEAIKFGKETVRKTQFTFGSVDTPVALQSDIVKTIAQLQNFTLKQTEFLTEMAKDKNFVGMIRYAVAGMAFVYTVGKAFGMEPEQLLPMFRFDTPPSLKLPVEVTKATLNSPDKFGNKRDLGEKASDIGKSAVGLFPAGSQIKKTIEGTQSVMKGGSYTKSGNLQFKQEQSLAEKAQTVIFGKYASQNAKDYFAGETVAEKELERLNKLPKEEANAIMKEYKENDPSMYRKVKALKQDEVLGITDKDKKIREMGVENLERAKYILKEANKFKTKEEKNAYIADLRKKKIISDEVFKQIKELVK